MKRRVIAVLVVMGFMTSASFAQQATKVLSFEDAVKIAMKNAVLLNQQKNNLELSQAQRTQSLAGLGPNVSLFGQADRKSVV